MNSPEPRLNKLPFYLTAIVCFVVVWLIGWLAPNRYETVPLLTAVFFLILSITGFILPSLVDYAADCRETSARLSNELEQQIVRVQAASESLTRAASQIKAIEEAVHKSARDAETLPYRMQEKLAEFNEALAEKETDDREALELELEELRSANSANLKSVADKIQKATADWAALEVSTRKQLALAQEAAAKIDTQLKNTLAQLELKSLAAGAQPAPRPFSAGEDPAPYEAEPVAAPVAQPAPAAAEPVVPNGDAPPAGETPKAKKPRVPRRPKPEDILAEMSAPVANTGPAESGSPEPTASAESDQLSEISPQVESSSSSDGATRLLATAYIGIGNKLFIRGDGPGLSWDKGAPMQFVSIGKWGWSTQDAVGPIHVKLLKNDEIAALTGELTLEPGRHTEITALF